MKKTWFLIFSISVSLYGITQNNTKADSLKASSLTPKLYHEVITAQAVTDDGLFKVHKVNDRYFFEIADSMLNREILVVNRISKAAADNDGVNRFMGYAGDEISKKVIQFVRGPANKLFINTISYISNSSDTTENGLFRAFINSNLQPIAVAFDIRAFSTDSKSIVIDVTDYLNSDNDLFSFTSKEKSELRLGSMHADRSYIKHIHSFPMNVETRTVKTFSGPLNYSTYELNSSIVLLPGDVMRRRAFDERVGYLRARFTNFDENPQAVEKTEMIIRWRLEPRAGDVDRYMKGELVEPRKPIIFYIDPATPKKWVPYLINGVNAWQKAFEKAGFKNAIYGLEAPVNDPEWSLEDSRHSAIVYKPSDFMNASGPSIKDPRSGEVLESHINWYHNIMQLLKDWYFVQTAAIDSKARKMILDDTLMGKLIQYVCTHEVGHTLGLAHNFGASSTVPVEKLRNKKWVEENGISPSVMDYARFNYVAQPEDNISEKGIFSRIGPYDEWAIEWGYRWFLGSRSEKDEKAYLNQLATEKIDNDKRLWFGNENFSTDPRSQAEDLGDDAIKASSYGIKNLKYIMSHLAEWTTQPDDGYEWLARMYKNVLDQHKRYLFHVTTIVGGFMRTPKTAGQPGPVVTYPSIERQKAALSFLNEQLFTTPSWTMDRKIYSLTGLGGVYELAYLQKAVIERVMSSATLGNLLWAQTYQPSEAYTVLQFFADMKSHIWRELRTRQPINQYRRNLQKIYSNQLVSLLDGRKASSSGGSAFKDASFMTDISSIIIGHVKGLIAEVNAALPMYKDELIRLHLMDVRDRLQQAVNPDNK